MKGPTWTGAEAKKRIGATTWGSCYSLSSQPVLVESVEKLQEWGTELIKVVLYPNAEYNYFLNSPDWPKTENVQSIMQIAQHSYFQTVWDANFKVYLILFAPVIPKGRGLPPTYWRYKFTDDDCLNEKTEIYNVASMLLKQYENVEKTFVFHNWEGDWSIRAQFNENCNPTEIAMTNMKKWLTCRQEGVTNARKDNPNSKSKVIHAAELNLVYSSILYNNTWNVVDSIIPDIEVDMISYSAYDTQLGAGWGKYEMPQLFSQAIDYILSHFKSTEYGNTLSSNILISEFGMGYNVQPYSQYIDQVIENVLTTCYQKNCAYTAYFQLYGNENTSNGKHCDSTREKETNPEILAGFWLMDPNGKKYSSYTTIQSLFNAEN